MDEPSPVTILFTDVEGSTDLHTSRGDDAAHEILRAHEELVRACVTEHGGREVKALGDGFMIAFASARRALGCATAIQQAVEKQRWTAPGGGVGVRIGVNTGEVLEEQGDLYGQAVNAAARIAARAKAGEILVAEVTKQLVGTGPDFTFSDRGRLRLKGFPDRWRLYGLVWAPAAGSDAPPPAPGRTPFVGRDQERQTLRHLLDQARRGTGGLVMIGGEPGVGKTRLAEELMADAVGRGMATHAGHCYEMEGAAPYVPFVEILETALARAPSPEAFVADLGEEAAEVARLLPRLRRLFPDLPTPLELPPEQERRYLFNSIREVLSRAARRQPLLVVLDDLQWADDPTILLVLHLAEQLAALPVLVVGTYRDTDVGRPLAHAFGDLRRRPGTTWVSLRRLSRDTVAELVHAMSGQPPPDQLVEALYSEAEGNPFFLEEVYRHLVEEGRLFDETGQFRTDLRISELDVPEGVRLVVGRRLERLGDQTVQILAAAAVIGRTFGFELLATVGAVDSDTLLDAVEDAERAHLIAAVADVAGEDRFLFAHELVRQTLVAGLSTPRRRLLHGRAADAMEQHYTANLDDHAAAIAHHLQQAGADGSRIFNHLVQAGRRALAGAAFEEALRHYESASEFQGAVDPGRRAAWLFELGTARRHAGRWDGALDAWRQSLDGYEELGDVEAVGRICQSAAYTLGWAARFAEGVEMAGRGLTALGDRDSVDRGRLLGMAAMAAAYGGRYEESQRLLGESLAIASRLEDETLQGYTAMYEAMVNVAFAEFSTAADAGLRAAEFLRATGDLWSVSSVLGFVLDALRYQGRLDDARRVSDELEPLAERLGNHGAQLMVGRTKLVTGFFATADLDELATCAEHDRQLGEATGVEWLTSVSWTWLGLAQFLRGHWEDARGLYEKGARLEPPGAPDGWSAALLFECLAYLGDHRQAMAILESKYIPGPGQPMLTGGVAMLLAAAEGLSILGVRDESAALYPAILDCGARTGAVCPSFIDGRLLERAAGISALAGRRFEDAEAHFLRAREQARSIPHRPEEAHTSRFYGQMLRERDGPGDRERAATVLGEAAAAYRRMGMPRHAEMAERNTTIGR